MRVQVTKQNILEYGLDIITGNSQDELLIRASEMERDGYELFINIPDVEGGDNDIPEERNAFEHYNSDLPDPDGVAHSNTSVNHIGNACHYQAVIVDGGELIWICEIHKYPSKHSVESTSRVPCLKVDP